MKKRPATLFLDDGGVLNDNNLRGPEWLRLLGEFMPDRMGGTAESWAGANRQVFPKLWKQVQSRMGEFSSHREFMQFYATSWLSEMSTIVGVQTLPDDDAVALYKEVSRYIAERANCEAEGAADAVRSLSHAGYTLHMASGTPSWELEGILAKMGISDAFSTLYGPDLVDYVKHGPGFYERLFAHAEVSPETVLVIESDSECCDWAAEAGAEVVWIDDSGRGDAATLRELVGSLL